MQRAHVAGVEVRQVVGAVLFSRRPWRMITPIQFASGLIEDLPRYSLGEANNVSSAVAHAGIGQPELTLPAEPLQLLNQSQGGMCICRVLGIGAGV